MVRPSTRRFASTGAQILATAAAYFVVAQPALLQQLGAAGDVRLLTPASGAALAALLVLGLRIWPGILLGSFFAAIAGDRMPLTAAGLAIGTTAGVVLAYLLLRRVGFRVELDRVRDAAALVAFGAVVGMVTGAAIRSGVLVLAGIAPAGDYGYRALLSWLSSAMGVLVATPFLLVLRRFHWPRGVSALRVAEAAALAVATIGVSLLVTRSPSQLLFLVFPLLIWAAWRFQLAGATPCALVVSVLFVYAGLNGYGPFEGADLRSTLITVHAFVASTTLATLFLAVAVTERNAARHEIENASTELVSALNRLERSLRPRGPLLDQNHPSRSDVTVERIPAHQGSTDTPPAVEPEATST